MGALDKLKKKSNKSDEVKIVQVDMNNVLETTLKDDDWDIATRENQEKIAMKEALLNAKDEMMEENDSEEVEEEIDVCVIPEFGPVNKIADSIMDNALELINVLTKAEDREQWLTILDYAKSQAFDITLLDYLFEHNYRLEEYMRNTHGVDSQVRKQSALFYRFLKMVIAEKDDDKLNKLLCSVDFVDDRIREIVVNSKDRNKIIRNNYLLRFDEDNKLFYSLLECEKGKARKDFSFLNELALTNLKQEDIDKLLDVGYEISYDTPSVILNNNELIRKLFLKDYDQNIINLLFTKLNYIDGLAWQISNFRNKQVLTKKFMKEMGSKDFINVVKNIEMSGRLINLDKIIIEDAVPRIKMLYIELNRNKTFNTNLFINLVNLYELNSELILNLCSVDNVKDYEKYLDILFNLDDMSIVNSLVDLEHIEDIIYDLQQFRINNETDVIGLKDYICFDLIGEHYLYVHKMLIELCGSEKLKLLRANLIDPLKKCELDKYINLSIFLEGLVECDNIAVLKNIATTVNECSNKSKIWNKDIKDLEKEVMDFYTYEINEKLTDINYYVTNLKLGSNGKNIAYVNIPMEDSYGMLIKVIPYYENNDNLKFTEDYILLSGITDEYTRIRMNKNDVLVLYNKLGKDSIITMADKEIGISYDLEGNVISNVQMNPMPFREMVRNTKQVSIYSINNYLVKKDGLRPSGILVFDIPSDKQIEAATFLNVPLVNIEKITDSVNDNTGHIDFMICDELEEELKQEEITHENNNDQFLELFGSLLEIKGESSKLSKVIDLGNKEYILQEKGITKDVLPMFRLLEFDEGICDVDKMIDSKVKSDIYKKLLPDCSINYSFKKVLFNGNKVLSAVYESLEEDVDISEYNVTDYLKKMAVSYLLGDPYDADSYQFKHEVDSKCEQLFLDIDLLNEYEDKVSEISKAYLNDKINIDFIELIDFIEKINAMDDIKYLEIFKEYISRLDYISPVMLENALLIKKQTLVKKIGEVIELFTKAKDVGI